jgi:integrase
LANAPVTPSALFSRPSFVVQICSLRLSDLRTADFSVYRDQRLLEIKPSSLRRELTPIRHVFEVARTEWGLPLRENPLAKLSLYGIDQRRERRLRAREFHQLIQAAQSSRNKLLSPIIVFALLTGMRRGEILSMKWSDRAGPGNLHRTIGGVSA